MSETLDTSSNASLTDLPLPKYRIGQTVYCASVTHETKMLPCPDCLGSRKWKITTPAGAELTTDCIRCGQYSDIRGVPSLRQNYWKAQTRQLTVGAIEANRGWGSRDGVSYMAKETGIGSGSVYPERDLYASQEEAAVAAEARATTENTKLDARPDRIEQHHFSQLRITDAAIKGAADATWNSWYRVNCLVGEIKEAIEEEGVSLRDLKSEIKQHIDFDQNYRANRDPFETLLKAAREAACAADLPALSKALAEPPFSLAKGGH